MNTRQRDILRILITESQQYLLVNDLAEKVGCSEKTIRNDFKKIEEFLIQHSNASIIRKPGLGVHLHIEDHEKVNLFNILNVANEHNEYISDEERKLQIAYQLLMSTKTISAHDFSSQYFVNRAVIKKDLDLIKKWLEMFELTLVSKQKIGLSIEGNEGNKRKALARLSELVNNPELSNNFIKKQFSSYEIDIVKTELKALQRRHSLYFTDESFEGLLVHTLFLIKRVKLNQPMSIYENTMIQVRNKKEYKWTIEFLKKLESLFAVHFPEAEIIYLALHILGGKFRYQQNDDLVETIDFTEDNMILTNLLNHLIKGLSDLYAIDFAKDQVLIDGLKVHLYTTLNRLNYGLVVSNPMLKEIKNMYPYMFNIVMNVLQDSSVGLPFEIPEEEAAYLTLHFQASVERFEKNEGKRKKAVVVCHMGIGMSQLLRTKIEKNFRFIDVQDCISKDDLKAYLASHDVDFVISTIALQVLKVPHIVVSPLLSVAEEKKLQDFIKQLDHPSNKKSKQSGFMKYVNPFLVFLQVESEHRYKLVEELATVLYKKGYVEKEYVANAVMRERMSSTTIGAGIAIPHGNPKLIKQPAVAIATLKHPLEWGSEKVSLVFMLAVKNEKQDEIKQLFQELSWLSEQPELIQSLINEADTMTFLNTFNRM